MQGSRRTPGLSPVAEPGPRPLRVGARTWPHVPRWAIGTVLSSPDPVLAERIAASFDFVWIDLEHSALTVRDAQTLVIAARAGGALSFVRLPRYDSEILGAVLDAGVDGVVAPKVESAAHAQALVARMSYPPAGTRGFAPRRASGGAAGQGAVAEPKRIACFAQIESGAAVGAVEAILATPGVDGIVVGTADLSLDLGCPLDMEARELVSAVEEVERAARRHDKPWGVAIGQVPAWVETLRGRGASMIVFSSDIRLYAEAGRSCAQRLREL